MVAVAGLPLLPLSALAKGAPSPLTGVTTITALAAGTISSACTITGGGNFPGTTNVTPVFKCANGDSEDVSGATDCPCKEATGQIKGTQIGQGTFIVDVIEDETIPPSDAENSLTFPGIGGSITCPSTTIVGVVLKSGLPVIFFTGTGNTCQSPGGVIPGVLNGSFVVTNSGFCSQPGVPCFFPTASGSGTLVGEFFPYASGEGLRFNMNGYFRRQ